jgi:hypothetical protein
VDKINAANSLRFEHANGLSLLMAVMGIAKSMILVWLGWNADCWLRRKDWWLKKLVVSLTRTSLR